VSLARVDRCRLPRVAVAALVLGLSACATSPTASERSSERWPRTFATAMARGLPSSVGVYGVHPRQAMASDADSSETAPLVDERDGSLPWTDRDVTARIGAGFFVSTDGLVVTASHVVVDAPQIIVKLSDRRVLTAELVGADREADIALVRVPLTLASPPAFGSSFAVRPGDWVLALGEPYGLDRSVAAGIVGGRSRHFAEDGELLFIQTDLSLNPGNSGGPLLDTEGRIVGMNLRTVVGALGGPGLSLSVPIEVVLQITAEIAAHGSVTRPRLGAGFEDVTPFVAVARGRAYASGALIHDVTPGSVAARLGLREGDIVVGMNGTAIGDSADLARALLRWRTVSGTRFTVFRDGAYRHLGEDADR
jgi:serine protease Do